MTGTNLVDAPAFHKAPGGAPANVAVGLSKQGIASGFMGKVGHDPFGHMLTSTLSLAGVDIGTLRHSSAARDGGLDHDHSQSDSGAARSGAGE